MVVHPKFIFIHLQKCAGMFTRNFLVKAFPDAKASEELGLGLHISVNTAAAKVDVANKFTFGNVRNPWSWYVSLYHYWMENYIAGGHYHLLVCTRPTFEEFMLDILTSNRSGNMHRVNFTTLRKKGIGILTYWHDDVFATPPGWVNRVENLRNDLRACFDQNGLILTPKQAELLREIPMANTSTHESYKSYYNSTLVKLVADMECKFITKYNYEY